MDLLSQYKQDHPEEFREKKASSPIDEYGREYSAMIRLVMRLSGGRIKDENQASYALLGAAIVIVLISLYVFFFAGGSRIAPAPGRIINESGVPPRLETPILPK